MNFDQLYQEYLDLDDPYYTVSLYDRLKWLYDKAHRHGWKQAKREAATIANDLFEHESGYYHYKDDVGDAISVMEYKEGRGMNITADECAECGSTLEEVRPGKWQCTKCELDQMLTDMYNAGYQAGLSKAQADHDYKMMGEGMRPNYIKYNFGKHYAKKPLTPFQKFWNGGTGSETQPKSHIAEDAWNAALYTARERLQMYRETAAIELLEILYED